MFYLKSWMGFKACEIWPIRADCAYQEGELKETGVFGAAAMGSTRQIMCFCKLKHVNSF